MSTPLRTARPTARRPLRTLALDVGGTALKAAVLDARGRRLGPVLREPTPRPATPERVLGALVQMAGRLPAASRAALGFPGVVRRGVVYAAPNLGSELWVGTPVERAVSKALLLPVRVRNDAVLHALGVVRGHGVELVLTLGTGLGSVLAVDGRLAPLELGHLPWRRGRSFEQLVGERARRVLAAPRWRARVQALLAILMAAFQPDVLWLGGGNALRLVRMPDRRVRRAGLEAAFLGAHRLWAGAHGVTAPGR